MRIFQLIPYPAKDLPKIDITAQVERPEHQLSIRYEVTRDVGQILFPAPSESATRKDDLWKSTCFEFFLAIPNQPQYWEFNMSPSGDWNVYMMDAYRQVNMREETAIQKLPFQFNQADDGLSLTTSIDLSPILRPEQNIQLGITAIIQTTGRNESYWALSHPGAQADFHRRESFVTL